MCKVVVIFVACVCEKGHCIEVGRQHLLRLCFSLGDTSGILWLFVIAVVQVDDGFGDLLEDEVFLGVISALAGVPRLDW